MRPKAAKEARTGLEKASWRRPNGGQERPESRGQRGLESLRLFGQALRRIGGPGGSPAWILEREWVEPPLKDGSPRGPWTGGFRIVGLSSGGQEPFQERSPNPLI